MEKQKPFELAFKEFNENLIKTINESGLPPAVISQSLQILLMQVNQAAESMYKKAQEIEGGEKK